MNAMLAIPHEVEADPVDVERVLSLLAAVAEARAPTMQREPQGQDIVRRPLTRNERIGWALAISLIDMVEAELAPYRISLQGPVLPLELSQVIWLLGRAQRDAARPWVAALLRRYQQERARA